MVMDSEDEPLVVLTPATRLCVRSMYVYQTPPPGPVLLLRLAWLGLVI